MGRQTKGQALFGPDQGQLSRHRQQRRARHKIVAIQDQDLRRRSTQKAAFGGVSNDSTREYGCAQEHAGAQ
jgi:hypothetical protein